MNRQWMPLVKWKIQLKSNAMKMNINMKKISNGTVDLIGKDRSPVKVCDVINGRPKVTKIIDL